MVRMFNKEMFPGEKIKHDSLELIEKGGFAEYYDPLSCAACGGGIHVDRGHGYRVCQPIGDRMKRSQVNDIMAQADEMIRSFGFTLPPFAYWSPETFKRNAAAARPIIDAQCGWDITDYGTGDFEALGLFLFTLRNGRLADLQCGGGMCYAEKLLISRQDQLSPMHTHVIKAEDIINRGGATLVVELFGSDAEGGFAEDQGGTVFCDGLRHDFAPGEKLRLAPGQSVTLMPGDWHAFWGDGGDVLIGEVSTVNDDNTDNIFREPIGRFSKIDEDEAPRHLLVSDYDKMLLTAA